MLCYSVEVSKENNVTSQRNNNSQQFPDCIVSFFFLQYTEQGIMMKIMTGANSLLFVQCSKTIS